MESSNERIYPDAVVEQAEKLMDEVAAAGRIATITEFQMTMRAMMHVYNAGGQAGMNTIASLAVEERTKVGAEYTANPTAAGKTLIEGANRVVATILSYIWGNADGFHKEG